MADNNDNRTNGISGGISTIMTATRFSLRIFAPQHRESEGLREIENDAAAEQDADGNLIPFVPAPFLKAATFFVLPLPTILDGSGGGGVRKNAG